MFSIFCKSSKKKKACSVVLGKEVEGLQTSNGHTFIADLEAFEKCTIEHVGGHVYEIGTIEYGTGSGEINSYFLIFPADIKRVWFKKEK